MDDFKDHPISISERQALKTEDPRKWSARDVLISVLRDIDSGKVNPKALVVGFYEELPDGKVSTNIFQKSDNVVELSGLIARMAIVAEL